MNQISNEPMIDLRQIFNIIRNYWIQMVAFVVVCALVGLGIASFLVSPEYSANANLIVNNVQTVEGGMISNSDVSASTDLANTFSWIIKSHSLLQKVIAELKLETTAEDLQKKIEVKAIEDTQIISISVRDSDPEQARRIAQKIADLAPDLIMEKVAVGSITPVDDAWVGNHPVSPNKKVYLAAGALVGLLLAIAYIVYRRVIRQTFLSADSVQHSLDLPMLGVIPLEGKRTAASNRKGEEIRKFHSVRESASFAYQEAYKSLATNLEYMLQSDAARKVLLVTSTVPAEGKTNVVLNLASVLASSGKRVVVIEADLRKGMMERYLDLPAGEEDLVSIIKGSSKLNEAIRRTNGGFDVLCAENQSDDPTLLLKNKRFPAILKALSQHYDIVFCDAPPMNYVADTAIMCQLADAAVFVVGYDQAPESEVQRAKEQLDRYEVPILGVVFNSYDTNREHRQGRNGYYEYGYYRKNE